MKKHFYLILLVISCCIASCKKDNEEIKDFSMEALTNGSWKSLMTDNNTSTNPSGPSNTYWPVPDCRKDDLHTYNNNGELLTNNGNTVCTEDEPAAKQAYTVDLANKKLTVSGIDYTILELSTTRLKLSRVIPTTTGYGNIIYLFGHP